MNPIPPNEAERLAHLARVRIPQWPMPVFDHVAKVAQQHFKVPIALVSIVEADRQSFAGRCGFGLPGTPRDVAFCARAVMSDDVFIVEDTHADERFRTNPLVVGDPHIRFYAGAPLIVSAGVRLGTVCIIDRVPRTLNFAQKLVLRHIAEIAVGELARFTAPGEALRPVTFRPFAETVPLHAVPA